MPRTFGLRRMLFLEGEDLVEDSEFVEISLLKAKGEDLHLGPGHRRGISEKGSQP